MSLWVYVFFFLSPQTASKFTNFSIPAPIENASCKLLLPDTLTNVMKKKSPVKPVKYEICKNGCMLFPKDDSSVVVCKNEKCKEPRFTNDMKIRREMTMVPVGQQMSMMLSNPKTRELMKCRSQYQFKPSTCEDCFDG